MAKPGTLKIGDEVRHLDWPTGVTRKVAKLIPLQFRGKTPIVVVVDEPVYPNGRKPKGMILDGQYDRWFEEGLGLIKPSNIILFNSRSSNLFKGPNTSN